MTAQELLIKEKLTLYVILKNKINILDFKDIKARQYVEYIEKSLLILNKLERNFIINVFVNNLTYYDVNLSRTCFYNKKNKLIKLLLLILQDIEYK